MAGASHSDVSSTLGALERKLKELERELQTVGASPPAPDPAPAPAAPPPPAAEPPAAQAPPPPPPPPAPPRPMPTPGLRTDAPPAQLVAEARASLGGLHGQLAELHRFRDQLERSARELMEEYTRVLEALGAGGAGAAAQPPPPAAAPAPAPAAAFPPAAAAGHAHAPGSPFAPIAPAPFEERPAAHQPALGGAPSTPLAPIPPVPPAAPPPVAQHAPPPPPVQLPPSHGAPPAAEAPQSQAVVVSGHVTVDAGPFTDIASLSSFEQALGRVPGAQDVYVRGFEGNRALIDVQLAEPVDLGAALRQASPMAFQLAQPGPNQVEVTLRAS